MWTLLLLTLVMASLAAAFLIAFYAGPKVWQVAIPIPGLERPLRISGYGIALVIVTSAFLFGAFTQEAIRIYDLDARGTSLQPG